MFIYVWDQLTPVPFSVFERVIKEDLGVDSSAIFREVDEDPVGCASLAQVHHGYLTTGEEVAIKIQYPTVARNTNIDLRNVEYATKLCERIFPRFQYSVDQLLVCHVVGYPEGAIDCRARVQLPRGGE